jgi:hypothetical protein
VQKRGLANEEISILYTNEKVLSGMKKLYLRGIILAMIVVALYAYQLITGSVELMPYSMLFPAAILLITGLEEPQKDRKGGFLRYAVVSLFLFVVSIEETHNLLKNFIVFTYE